VAFRGTLNVNAVFGGLSNVATGSTAASAPAPVASAGVSPATLSQIPGATQQLVATLKDASGNVLTGRTITWTSSNEAVATVSTGGLETAVAAGSATITAASGGITGTVSVNVTAPVITKPGTVVDLAVAGVTDTSATLSFTEVNDGTGSPASYDVRSAASPLSWGSAPEVIRGTCATPLAGSAIGAKRMCTVLGLSRTTAYGFQLVAFRGTLNVNAVFGGLSNVATGSTAASAPAPVASVGVSPATLSQIPGATQQLVATLKDASGNVLTGRAITWTSGNPAVAAVSGSALETAVAAGSATVTATSGGITGRAVVNVTVPVITKPGTVADLAVAGVTDTSATLSFTEVNDGTGSPATYDVRSAVSPLSWGSALPVTRGTCATPLAGKASGGKRTCTVLGLSPATAYGFQLIAFRGTLNVNAVFGSLSNLANGTTAGAQPPQQPQQPQPSLPLGSWPNEPGGLTQYSDQPWDGLGSWALNDNTAGNSSLGTLSGVPFSPSGVLQYRYPQGMTGGGDAVSPGRADYFFPVGQQPTELYVGLWVKLSDPFDPHSSGVQKILYLHDNNGVVFSALWLEIYGTAQPFWVSLVNQFSGCPSIRIAPNVAQTPIRAGEWHRYEMSLKLASSGGASDGVLKVWVDGTLNVSRTDVCTLGASSGARVESVRLSGLWGGVADSKTETDYLWYDHTHVSGH